MLPRRSTVAATSLALASPPTTQWSWLLHPAYPPKASGFGAFVIGRLTTNGPADPTQLDLVHLVALRATAFSHV